MHVAVGGKTFSIVTAVIEGRINILSVRKALDSR